MTQDQITQARIAEAMRLASEGIPEHAHPLPEIVADYAIDLERSGWLPPEPGPDEHTLEARRRMVEACRAGGWAFSADEMESGDCDKLPAIQTLRTALVEIADLKANAVVIHKHDGGPYPVEGDVRVLSWYGDGNVAWGLGHDRDWPYVTHYIVMPEVLP